MSLKMLYAFPEPLPLPKARGVQVAWTVDTLSAAGTKVTLAYVPVREEHPLSHLGKAQYSANLQLVPISHSWPFPLHRWHSGERFVRSLLQWIDRDPSRVPDVIFVRHLKLAFRLLRARPGIPLIYEAHECFAATAPSAKRKTLAAKEAFVLAHAAGVVFISKAVRDTLQKAYSVAGEQIILHSAVDIPPAAQEKDWENCCQHIVYAGSFFGWKGVEDLVDAAAYLPGHRITLIGGNAEEIAELKRRVASGAAAVDFLPRLPVNQVMAHLQNACIAVLPNRAEGVSQFTSPLKLFEYMGAGCAVVASDLPSLREVLPSDSASWFSPGSPTSLAEALRRLTDDPSLARTQGQMLRQLAEKHTWESRSQSLAHFAGTLLAERARKDAPPKRDSR